jgi:hypothetical protein
VTKDKFRQHAAYNRWPLLKRAVEKGAARAPFHTLFQRCSLNHFYDAASAGVNEHWSIVDDGVAILANTVLLRHLVVGHARFGELAAAQILLCELLSRRFRTFADLNLRVHMRKSFFVCERSGIRSSMGIRDDVVT